jgi:hypothetical protein
MAMWSATHASALKVLVRLGLVETGTIGRAGVHTTNERQAFVAPLRALVDPDAWSVAKRFWMSWIAIDPSPTAEATRLTDRCRTSPDAKTPGMLASSSEGGRSSGHR